MGCCFVNMGFRALAFTLIFCILTIGTAQGSEIGLQSRELGIADIPPCGLQCLLFNIADSGCSLNDFQCQCGSIPLAKSVEACMLANCTMEDSLGFAKVQDDMCNLSEASKSHEVLIYTCVCYPLAVFFVALRFISKFITKRVRKEDWIILASLAIAGLSAGCILKMTTIGFGKHLWNLESGQLLRNLRYFYISWSTYIVVLGMIKSSLVMFYLEIFPAQQPRRIAYAILVWIIVNSLILFLLTAFNCWPVNSFWDRDIKGRCIDINALAYAHSGSAIVQDLVLLIFPLACIRQLKLVRHRKIAVGLMFSVGTMGCIASIIRLQSLFTFKPTLDPTWDYVAVTVWTEIELACCFVCVSLPAIRVLLGKVFPRSIFSSATNSRHTHEPLQSPAVYQKHPMPQAVPTQPKKKKKRQSVWMRLSAAAYRTSSNKPPSVDWPAGWSPRPWSGPSAQQRNKSHQRLDSNHDNTECMDFSHVRTCTPPVPEPVARLHLDAEIGLVPVSESKAEACLSCDSHDGYLTALPDVGCLPDENYSSTDLGPPVPPKTGERKWQKCPVKDKIIKKSP